MPLSTAFGTMTNKRKFDDVSEGAFHIGFNPQWQTGEDDSMAISPPPSQKMRFTGQQCDDRERLAFGKKCKMNGDFWDSARTQDVAEKPPRIEAGIATPPYQDAAIMAESSGGAQSRDAEPITSHDPQSAHHAELAAREALAWQQRRADPKKSTAILASGYSRSQSPNVQPGSFGGQYVTREEFEVVQGQMSVLKETCLSLIQEVAELRAQIANAACHPSPAQHGMSDVTAGVLRPGPIYFAPHQHIPAP